MIKIRDFLPTQTGEIMMHPYLIKKYAVLLLVIFTGILPTLTYALDKPVLPQPMEIEGIVQNVEPYDCTKNHRYWCGRIVGTVWINDENGNVVSSYLKKDTTMFLNGDSTYFQWIKRGDKAKIIYFEDKAWASSLELGRQGS